MIIDDEIDVRELLALLLERDGYRVAGADDGETGLAMVKSFRPNLVITDHLMPGLSGREIVRAMRATPALATIPVIMVTGAPMREALQDADGAIAVEAFLPKPSTWKLLREVVRAALGKRDAAPSSRDSPSTSIANENKRRPTSVEFAAATRRDRSRTQCEKAFVLRFERS